MTITLSGPASYSAVTDANGTYTIANVVPGIYTIAATKAGFESALQSDAVVVAGSNQYGVTLQQPTLTTVQEIGRTRTNYRRSGFNTTPASVANVTQDVFAKQGALQVQRVLDQVPGVVIDHPGTNATNASPGAITFPSVRGGLGFETSSLIDGHPLAVGSFGDYVTTFLNSDVLQNVEVVKGPGASLPTINYAINGAINFRTLDVPTRQIAEVKYGADGYGGTFSNFRYGNSLLGGKLQFVFDYAVYGTPGPLDNARGFTSVPGGSLSGLTTVATPQSAVVVPGVQNNAPYGNLQAVACCLPVIQEYNNKNELAKLRYNFSPTTSLTASYLGSQTYTDQNGNHVYQYTSNFVPGAAFPGAIGNGAQLTNGGVVTTWQSVFYPYTEYEINNEPIFQAELRTTIGHDNLLARGYTATIQRLQYQGENSPFQTAVYPVQLFGSIKQCPTPGQTYSSTTGTCTGGVAPVTNVYTGQQVTVSAGPSTGVCGSYAGGWIASGTNGCGTAANPYTSYLSYPFFRSNEEDHLRGGSFQYDHLFGDSGNVLSVGADYVYSATINRDFNGSAQVPSIPDGSFETWQTAFLRGQFALGPKVNVTLTDYLNLYRFHIALNPQTLAFGSTVASPVYVSNSNPTWNDNTVSHMDPRVGIEIRPDADTAVRLSAGSSIAPPYLSLLTRNTAFATRSSTTATFFTFTVPNPNIVPETAFGYDVGFDRRIGADRATVLSVDGYHNNLWNQFISGIQIPGFCAPVGAGTGATGPTVPANPDGSCASGYLPAVGSKNGNLATSIYEGIEVALARDPAIGFGWRMQGSLMRAYTYNLPPCFYSTVPSGQPCNVATNLGILPNVNFQNSGTAGSPGSFNVISNHSEPYSQAYLEAHVRTRNGGYGQFGYQLYGPNNSLNVPAFWVGNVSARFPLLGSNRFTLNTSIDNVFSAYANAFISPYGGVTVPLANGNVGLTNANVIGPRNLHVWAELDL